MIYNRKRPGDIERALVAEYENKSIIDRANLPALSDNEKQLAENLARFVTRGKLNSYASVLIPKKVMKAMELILKHRREANVPDSNQFLFADPKGKSYPFYKAQYIMKKFCSKHSLDYNLFKANKIRKHLASCTTSLDKDQQQVVSDFMGHSMAIHKNIYQLPLIQKDILTMGKILSQAGGYSTGDITTTELELVTEAATNIYPDWLEDSDQYSDDHNENINVALPSELSDVQEVSMEINESIVESPPQVVKPSLLREETTPMEIQTSTKSQSSLTNKSLMRVRPPKMRKPPRVEIPRHILHSDSSSESEHSSVISPKKRLSLSSIKRVTYTTPERKTLRETFSDHIRNATVPSVNECKDLLHVSEMAQSRTVPQIQSWVRAEITRKLRSIETRGGWTTPQKAKCRTYFKDYYKSKRILKYPSEAEILEAIYNIPEFKGKTTKAVRSHLQHDYVYVKKHNLKL